MTDKDQDYRARVLRAIASGTAPASLPRLSVLVQSEAGLAGRYNAVDIDIAREALIAADQHPTLAAIDKYIRTRRSQYMMH